MHDDKSIIRSAGGDTDACEEELEKYHDAWKKMEQIGNLPLAILVTLAVKYKKKEPKPRFTKATKQKEELVTADG